MLGGQAPLPGRRPPSRSHLEGAGPLLLPLQIEGQGEGCIQHTRRNPSPPQHLSSSVKSLAKPCRSTAAPPLPCRRAAVGAIFLNLSFPLAGSRRRRRYADRTCVERGDAVRSVLGSPVIWMTSCSTTSSPFLERFRTRSTKVCRWI